MAQTQASGSKHAAEATFKNYNSAQANAYAKYRDSYNPALISIILSQHTSTGGALDTLLDIGCGPGTATQQFSGHFSRVFGADASASMIEHARANPPKTSIGEPATFAVCGAEDIAEHFPANSVDLITIATAVHWFDMPKFYEAAAKVLKPNGSIAMWGGSSMVVDAATTPHVDEMQKLWDDLEFRHLDEFMLKGNLIVRDMYASLDMPWTIDSPEMAKTFEQSRAYKRIFNQGGKPEPDDILKSSNGFLKKSRETLERARYAMGTASPVTRWREAHKEQLEKGEIEDCVDKVINASREVLRRDGGDRDWVEVVFPYVLVVLKRS